MTKRDIRRRHTRVSVNWRAVLLIALLRIPVDIIDISEGGARIRSSDQLPDAKSAILIVDRVGSLDAEVVWTRAKLSGLRFTEANAATLLKPLIEIERSKVIRFGRKEES